MPTIQRPPVRKTETRNLKAKAPVRQWKDRLDVWVDSFLQKLAQKSASVRKALRRVKPQHALSAVVLAGSALIGGNSQAAELFTPPFKVSDTLNSGANPQLSADSNGNFVVVWAAYDIPATKTVVYAQRFNAAAAPQGGAIVIPSVGAATTPTRPNVAVDADGDFVVVWQEAGAIQYDIFAQRFSSAGAAQGSVLPVAAGTAAEIPGLGIDAVGDFVVAWDEYADTRDQLFVRQFTAAGVPSAPLQITIDGVSTAGSADPQVAMDAAGNFVVAWQDTNFYVRAARFNGAGIRQGNEIDLTGTLVTDIDSAPVVAMDARGDFVVVWHHYDAASYFYETRVQLFSPGGVPSPNLIKLNENNTQLEVAISPVGDFVIGATTYGYYDTHVHRFTAAGVLTSSIFLSNSNNSSIVLDRFGNLTAAYSDYNYGTDYIVRYHAGFIHLDNTANTSVAQLPARPSVAMDANGNFVVVWQGYSETDIYGLGISARLFNSYGVPVGPEIQVNTAFDGDQTQPQVAMDKNGNFAVVWTDTYTYDLKARAFNAQGVATSSEVVVQNNFYYDTGCVAMDPNGTFAVGWSKYYYNYETEEGYYESFVQRFSVAGSPGALLTIIDSSSVDIAVDPNGNSVVVDQSYSDGSIYISLFDAAGDQKGESIPIGNGYQPHVAVNANGDFVVSFESNGEYSPITVVRFDASGAQVGNSIQIDNVVSGTEDIAMDARGNFTVVWANSGAEGGYESFAQRFDVSGEASGNPLVFFGTESVAAALDPKGDLVVAWDGYNYFSGGYDARFTLLRVAVPDVITVFQDSAPVAVPVLENDGNAAVIDSSILITSVTQGAHGTVTITGDGTGLTYQPATGFTGVDTFTYTVEGAALGAQDTTVGVTVVPASDRPTLANDSKIVNQGVATPIDVLANDTNPTRFTVPLKITTVTQGANGLVTISGNGTGVEYTPNVGFVGADSFLYTVTTENGGTATARVNINVNTPPTIQSGPTANPNPATVLAQVQLSIVAVDAEGTVTVVWDFGDGTTDNSNNPNVNHTFTPAGTYTIRATITDGGGLTDSKTLQLVVNPIGFGGPPGDVDSDGDGFSDELEQGAGSSPTDVNSKPNGATKTNDQIQTPKLAIKSNFGKVDSATLGGVVQIPSGFQVNGAQVVANIGGVIKTFVLDAKGKSPKGDNAFVMVVKSAKDGSTPSQKSKFSLKLNKFEFSDKFTDEGFTTAAAKKVPKTVKCELILRGHYYSAIVNVTYTSNGKTGAAK